MTTLTELIEVPGGGFTTVRIGSYAGEGLVHVERVNGFAI